MGRGRDLSLIGFSVGLFSFISGQIVLVPVQTDSLLPFNPQLTYNPVNESFEDFFPDSDYKNEPRPVYTENFGIHWQKENEKWLDDVGDEENTLQGLNEPEDLFDSLTPRSCGSCYCGLRFRYKIVGGQITKRFEFPWMTVILYKNEFICGGSLLNDRYVVTASHCVFGRNLKKFSVRFNDYNQLKPNETKSYTRKIGKVIIHPNYNPETYESDITLLKLVEPLILSTYVVPRPICLPTNKDTDFAGRNAVAAGWGALYAGGPSPAILNKVVVPVITNKQCRETILGNAVLDNMLCAGYPQGGKDTCQGDSGGPFMVIQKRRFRLIGVTSWGLGCADPNSPGLYARVTNFKKWLMDNTKDACYCK